jgi:catecholate siderophore receptor
MSVEWKLGERLVHRGLGITAVGLGSLAASTAAFGQTVASNDTQIETVSVTARRSQLDKLPEEIRNTAQSIDVVPLEVMQQQGTTSLQQALRNVPGITLNAGEGGAHGDTINLRGFTASDDFFLDGLRDTGFYDRDPFNLDAIEVYKGPASTLFGRGSTGGVINQVSKTPQLYPIDEAMLTAGTSDLLRATADVNYVLGDSSAVRINAMGERAGVAERDEVLNQRYGFAPSVAFGIDKPTTLTLSYFHQDENNIPDYGIPFLFGKVAPVPRDSYYGLVNDDRTATRVDIGTAHLTHDFGDSLSFQDTARYGNYWFDFRITAPHFGGGPGEPPLPVPGQPLDTILVLRDRPSVQGVETTAMNESDLTYKFATGSMMHTLVTGIEVDRETDDLNRFTNPIDAIPPAPLLGPDPYEPCPGCQTSVGTIADTAAFTTGIYALDTADFGHGWSAVGAIRFDRFDVHYNSVSYGPPVVDSQFHHVDNEWSPRAALLYKPSDTQTYYLSYGTSFDPSAENLSLSSRNADLPPEQDRTFEAGAKTLWLGGLLGLNAAVFNTEMLNARVGDPNDPLLQTLAGKEEVNGIELGATGRLTEQLEIVAGYTYIDPRTVKSTDPTQVGQMLPNTAHNQANLWLEYEFDDDWEIGAGGNYLGKRFADPQNTATVPAYATWDAMAGYKFNDHFSLQLNGYNLTNELYYANLYWNGVAENHAVPGAGRTITLTAKLDL